MNFNLNFVVEIIPRTLAQNCGANTIKTLTALRAKHANYTDPSKPCTWGIDGETGELIEMEKKELWEPLAVRCIVFGFLFHVLLFMNYR